MYKYLCWYWQWLKLTSTLMILWPKMLWIKCYNIHFSIRRHHYTGLFYAITGKWWSFYCSQERMSMWRDEVNRISLLRLAITDDNSQIIWNLQRSAYRVIGHWLDKEITLYPYRVRVRVRATLKMSNISTITNNI